MEEDYDYDELPGDNQTIFADNYENHIEEKLSQEEKKKIVDKFQHQKPKPYSIVKSKNDDDKNQIPTHCPDVGS